MGRARYLAFAALLAFCGQGTPLMAKPVSIIGKWTIVSSKPAPWIAAGQKEVAEDQKALIGHEMVFTTTKVTQPSPPLNPSCRPHYQFHDYGPEMMFEGGLTDPAKQSAALGFQGKTIPTVETGCEGVAAFHFLDGNTALFALNNSIYRLERRKP